MKKLPLDPPLTAKVAVRCYCQRFFSLHDFFTGSSGTVETLDKHLSRFNLSVTLLDYLQVFLGYILNTLLIVFEYISDCIWIHLSCIVFGYNLTTLTTSCCDFLKYIFSSFWIHFYFFKIHFALYLTYFWLVFEYILTCFLTTFWLVYEYIIKYILTCFENTFFLAVFDSFLNTIESSNKTEVFHCAVLPKSIKIHMHFVTRLEDWE